MNYTPLVINKIEEFSKRFPDLTFMEILYSSLREIEELNGDIKRGDLLKISDQKLYSAIFKAIDNEEESGE